MAARASFAVECRIERPVYFVHECLTAIAWVADDFRKAALGNLDALPLAIERIHHFVEVRQIARQWQKMGSRQEDLRIPPLIENLQRAGGSGLEMSWRHLRVIDVSFELPEVFGIGELVKCLRQRVHFGMRGLEPAAPLF